MKVFHIFLLLATSLLYQISWAQTADDSSKIRKHFVSTSAFMIGNLIFLEESPRFLQLNYGYRITPKDAIIVEAITWQYHAPLGVPYGPDFGSDEVKFPGFARDYGIGLAYQRFWWKRLYTTIHATPFRQHYFDLEGEKIQSGFQLFMVGRLGWQFRLFEQRLFIEPSLAVTHWPINTNLPESFQAQEDRWPNYLLFEPGLHIGWNF